MLIYLIYYKYRLKIGIILITKKEISKILGIDQNTLKNWESNRPELHKIVINHFEKRKCSDLENKEYLIKEIIEDLEKLPLNQVKVFQYMIKTKLAEMGH